MTTNKSIPDQCPIQPKSWRDVVLEVITLSFGFFNRKENQTVKEIFFRRLSAGMAAFLGGIGLGIGGYLVKQILLK